MNGYTLWFTGLSGAGKTTIAKQLAKELRKHREVFVLDGDDARKFISYDLGHTKYDRDKHITRMAGVCYITTQNNILTIASVISPTQKIRKYARNLIGNFIEIYIDCPLDVCEDRDVKGLYAKAREDEEMKMVGINVPYQPPNKPEIHIHTDTESVNQSVQKILKYLKKENII